MSVRIRLVICLLVSILPFLLSNFCFGAEQAPDEYESVEHESIFLHDLFPDDHENQAQAGWSLVLPVRDLANTELVELDDLKRSCGNLRIALDACKQNFEHERRKECLLVRRAISPELFEQDVERAFRANFARTPDIDIRKIYEYLQLEQSEGIGMSHDMMLRLLDEKLASRVIEESEYRQLRYPFVNALAKQEYDAFLTGTLSKLHIGSPKERQKQVDRFERINAGSLELEEMAQSITRFSAILTKTP